MSARCARCTLSHARAPITFLFATPVMDWSEACQLHALEIRRRVLSETASLPRWEQPIAVRLALNQRADVLRAGIWRAGTSTPNALRGLLHAILSTTVAPPSLTSTHPAEAWLWSVVRRLDTHPLETTDSPGLIDKVVRLAQEMLAAVLAEGFVLSAALGSRATA